MKDFFGEEQPGTVFISKEQLSTMRPGPLWGKHWDDTSIFNIFPPEFQNRGDLLGRCLDCGEAPLSEGFCAVIEDGAVAFYKNGTHLAVESYALKQDVFSRNSGILETDVMNDKHAVIIGCGSVGSLVALELARAGVGHFFLVDTDTLEYHNVCRHQCGIEDVGDLKVNALKRRIQAINPWAEVLCSATQFQNTPKAMLDEFCLAGETLFVGCGDNRASDVYANRIAIYYGAAFLSIGFWERAAAGEVFYHIPGKGLPCYECALGGGSEVSGRSIANHHVYSNEEDLAKVTFEPGISTDISFVTIVGVKLALDILNERTPGYIPRVLNDLTQYTLIANTCNTDIGGEQVDIFSYPLQITRSLVCQHGVGCAQGCKYESMARQE